MKKPPQLDHNPGKPKKSPLNFSLWRVLITLAMLAGLFLVPQPGLAALGIISVQPTSAPNNVETQLTITGIDFEDGAVVSLGGYGNLITTFVNTTTLTARLPAGVPAGIYDVVVTNPDASQVTLYGGLNVFTPSPTPTRTVAPTATYTQAPVTFERPLVVVQSYRTDPEAATPGGNLDIYVTVYNAGQRSARNILISFMPGNLLPLSTGGIIAIGEITAGDKVEIKQPFTATWDIWGLPVATVDMSASYLDPAGESYSEKFTLTIPVVQPKGGSRTATPTPTTTPTSTPPPPRRPQLVIKRYTSSVTPLQPGVQFDLEMQVQNVGDDLAKNTTLIIGGGGSNSSAGTAEPGGISGAGGEFSTFAPLGASNIQALGDIPVGEVLSVHQSLVVNVNTNPGAFPMRVSFTYLTERGLSLTDEQVITLLVYQLPSVEINFYRDPGPLFARQPNMLPLQIVNLGRKSTVLGNMHVTAPQAEFSNNTILVGTLDTGGYFTLDTTLIPAQPGPLSLLVTVDYTDDFNQSQQITRTLTLDIQEAMQPEGPVTGGGEIIPPEQQPETFLQKVWRFILGFLGLDSARPTQQVPEAVPVETQSQEAPVKVQPPLKGP